VHMRVFIDINTNCLLLVVVFGHWQGVLGLGNHILFPSKIHILASKKYNSFYCIHITWNIFDLLSE